MATLEDVRRKWPSANYAPRENCKWCNGTGEKTANPGMPCICIYVAHDTCDFAAKSLGETARKIRKEMGL